MVLGLATEVVKYAVGSWTAAVTALVIAVELATTGFVVALAATQQVVSTELLSRASDPAAVDLAVGRIIIVSALVVGTMSVVEAVRGHHSHRARLSVD
jgi:Mn2+/Fe2+ NRAMP family transporter